MKTWHINWVRSLPFLMMHAAAIAVFFVPFSWNALLLCLAMYYLRMFAITAGYHRYFSHRAYKMGRLAQFVMAWFGSMALQKGVLWWAANHRLHHRYSDQMNDIHSPLQRGFLWAHIGWILSDEHELTRWDQVRDLAQYPELRWINKYHLIPAIIYGALMFLLGGWGAFVWGFVVSTVLLWHGTFTINSLMHLWGSRRYTTTDTSRNSFLLALITLGEGWHNNHHCYMGSANQGFFWWEFDGSYYVLVLLSWLGAVYDLRKAPLEVLSGKRMDRGAVDLMPSPLITQARANLAP